MILTFFLGMFMLGIGAIMALIGIFLLFTGTIEPLLWGIGMMVGGGLLIFCKC